MDNLIGVATTVIIFQALACLANGILTLSMPGTLVRKLLIMFAISLPSTIAALCMAGTILSMRGAATGEVWGMGFAGWFIAFFAVQGVGTWSLVAYSAYWIYMHQVRDTGENPRK